MSFRSRPSLPTTGERQMYSRSIDLDLSNTENQYDQGSDQKLRPRHSGTQGILEIAGSSRPAICRSRYIAGWTARAHGFTSDSGTENVIEFFM